MKSFNNLFSKSFKLTCFTILLVGFSACNQNTESTAPEAAVSEAEAAVTDPLPSWNEGETKAAIINYVNEVTNSESANFIPISERISTFDIWAEQPVYFQLYFVLDRIKEMAIDNPEWKDEQPFKAVLENDMEAIQKSGMEGIGKLLMTTHAGNTAQEFNTLVKDWITTAKHPTKNVGYDKLVYQPMLELLAYLRANDFKTYIVSGGGVDFMRAFVSPVYGIPSEQIIGSRIKTEFDYNDGNPRILRTAGIDFIDDKDGKPLNIQKIIGKKPIFASGNSDGDLQMLQWTDSNTYKSFQLYLHHTDANREWAYDRDSHIGRLDKGLDEANQKGWTVIDMKKDWKIIYPFQLER